MYDPTKLFLSTVGGAGIAPNVWIYHSTDPHTTVDDSGYFTDGYRRGMKLGDVVHVVYLTGYLQTTHAVSVVGGTVGDHGQSIGAITISAAVLA